MKKTVFAILMGTLAFAACKSKKSASSAVSHEPSEAQLTAVKTKIPDASMADLKKGHDIYYGACTNCHGAKNVSGFTEEHLKNTIDQMAPKARLSDAEKDAVWKYALAVNLASKK